VVTAGHDDRSYASVQNPERGLLAFQYGLISRTTITNTPKHHSSVDDELQVMKKSNY